jgi:fatty-acyl-CoA synthase
MSESPKLITGLADVERIESIPLEQQYDFGSTYEMLQSAALRFGDKNALIFLPSGSAEEKPFIYTHGELLRRVTQTANLLHRLGVGADDVVAYLLPNLPQTHFVLWGGEAAGIVCPVNPLLEAGHIIEVLRAANAKVLVTVAPGPGGDELWKKTSAVVESVPSLETVLLVRLAQYLDPDFEATDSGPKSVAGRTVLDLDSETDREPGDRLLSGRSIQPTDIASYFHTGGTTGTPKIARHTHANEVFISWQLGKFLDLGPGSVFLCGLPLFHVNAAFVTGLGTFAAGGTVLLAGIQGYRTPGLIAGFWKLIEKYRVNFFSGVPTIYAALLDVPVGETDVSSLRFAACGAAPMPPDVIRRFESLTGLSLLEGYGLTEVTCATCLNPPAGERRAGSIGLRLPYQKVKAAIVDEEGRLVRQCEENEIGNLLIAGPAVFPGYLRVEDNRKAWPEEGWFNTGDLCRIDADGYVWLTGRAKDLIIRGGHNIDPQMIEDALAGHPEVALAAAVGQPDAYAGELPMAYVERRPGSNPDPQELVAFCREHIAERAAVPVRIVVLDALPLTAVGKTYKPELRMRAIEHVLTEALREKSVAATVTARADKRFGTVATVRLGDKRQREIAEEVLGKFAVASEIE